MNFGHKVMKKYGWKEGDGLGKNLDGITEAIRPKRKSNVLGLGYKLGNEFKDNWWENIYDRAASSIIVKNDEEGGSCSVSNLDISENDTHNMGSLTMKSNYRCFVKEAEVKSDDEFSDGKNVLSDDRIFKKCNGRTAHKAARHGLTLSGKLSRLEKQEQSLQKRLNDDILKATKKKKRIR